MSAARANGLDPHWKVRVVMRGGQCLHFASRSEPSCRYDPETGLLAAITMDTITAPEYGDTPGYMCYADVAAVSWRYAP